MNGQEGLLRPAPAGTVDRLIAIGKAVLAEVGEAACREGYGTADPEWVGRYALMYGDANEDGTLN